MKGLTEPERLAAEVRAGEITRAEAIGILRARRRVSEREAEQILDTPPPPYEGRRRRDRH